MSDKMRWRYGDRNPVVAAVDSSTVIEIGDLVWQDFDDAKPASDLPEQGSINENLKAFAEKFLGVAMQRSREGDMAPIRVATTGVFEFDCLFNTFELGDPVGVYVDCGAGLKNQQVSKLFTCESGPTASFAIARVAKREPAAAQSVLVHIRSTVMTGGVNGTTTSVV